MLHSALPRAFLPPPGLCYLGGYYGESVHPYSSVARFLPLENTYASIQGNHRSISPLELARSVSPSPLDLSLKPISRHSPRTVDVETIEVDDVEDQRNDGYGSVKKYSQNWENQRGSEDLLQSPVPRSFVYDDLYHENSSAKGSTILTTNLPYSNEAIQDYASPSTSPLSSQKLLLSSPSSIRSMHTYQQQQQLLLTPQNHLQSIHAPMTPPSTPSPPQCPRRRPRDEDETTPSNNTTPIIQTPKSSNDNKSSQRPKKKHARRLKFDEDTSSPVSGTVILGPDEAVVTGDIDPAFNIVEVTEEARAELAKIENRLGPYQCKLCQQLHDDAFQLAQHRCSRIAHVEYRCPECDKRFSCPANLASHRRWHKPRVPAGEAASLTPTTSTIEIPCNKCDAKFTRQAALRKHLTTQHPETNNNTTIVNINNNNICMETSNDSMISPKPHVDGMPLWVAPHSSEMA